MIDRRDTHVAAFERQLSEFLPGISIDCVILGFQEQQLKILLVKWKHETFWSLPGGFILKNEDMDEAAHRILSERTGLGKIFLNQLYTFGGKERLPLGAVDQRIRMEQMIEKFNFKDREKTIEWFKRRFITTAYFALVDIAKSYPRPDFLSEKCEWCALSRLPELVLDHSEIVHKALEYLRIQSNYLPIGISLLPHKFTMADLQKLYEAILGKELERSNFQRKMLKLGVFRRHEKKMTGAANKAPYLYSFDKVKYNYLIDKGIGFSL